MIVERKPRIGLLLIGSPRFKPLGEGTAHGTYEARKLREEKEIIIYPLKPQIFKGNNLSGNSDFIYNRHKKKNVTRGILEPFVTFYYNFSGYPVQ